MVPVNLLSENRVNALIVGGIGMRPLMGLKQVGIDVYHDDQRIDIAPVVEDLIAGNLTEIRNDQVCGGSRKGVRRFRITPTGQRKAPNNPAANGDNN